MGPDTGGQAVESALKDEEGPVHGPSLGVRECLSVNQVGEVADKLSDALILCGKWNSAVVYGCANPHIPHEKREEDHQSRGTPGSAELKMSRVVYLGVHAGFPPVDELVCRLVRFGMAVGRLAIAVEQWPALVVGGCLGGCWLHLVLFFQVLYKFGGPSFSQ